MPRKTVASAIVASVILALSVPAPHVSATAARHAQDAGLAAAAMAGSAENLYGREWPASCADLVGTPVGGMTLIAYLPSRVSELAIHTLDLATAVGVAGSLPDAAAAVTLDRGSRAHAPLPVAGMRLVPAHGASPTGSKGVHMHHPARE